MVVPFPSKSAAGVELTEDDVVHIARTEAYLDELLRGLYAQLPDDPARYPIRIGDFTIHYRHRPRAVVTEEPRQRAG